MSEVERKNMHSSSKKKEYAFSEISHIMRVFMEYLNISNIF